MGRREFTLQMHPGRPLPPSVVPAAEPVSHVGDYPRWRCSRCLMAWGVYGPTSDQGRPTGKGCGHCRSAVWIPASSEARMVDEAIGLASRIPFGGHRAAPLVMAAVEEAVAPWHRLTHTCHGPIEQKVRPVVSSVIERWVGEHRLGRIAFQTLDFSPNMMTVGIGIGRPGDQRREHETFCVRYRWVQ